MPPEHTTIRYATGEVAQIGDRVINDVWDSIVEDIIDTPERKASWGLDEPGLMFKCKEAGLVFEPYSSTAWDAVIFKGRAK